MVFTEESKVKELLESEKGPEIMSKFGVPCPTCPHFLEEAGKLTIGDACETYGIDVKKLLEELNK